MVPRLLKVIFASLLGIILYHGSAEELLVLPEGEEHSILCTAPNEQDYLINWGANGGAVGDGFVVGEEEILDDDTKGKRITFTATDDINSTSLRCVVSDTFQASNSSIPIHLTIIIQGVSCVANDRSNILLSSIIPGLLSAPDVEYTKGDRSILFSWSPPFSHNITDVEPDISHYLVTIINMEDHHSVLTVNTTDTEYLLQSQDCQLSDYQVEIAAVNVVGVGGKYTSPPLTLEQLTIDGMTPELKLFVVESLCFTELVIPDTVTVFLGLDSPVINNQVNASGNFDIIHANILSEQRGKERVCHSVDL